MNEEQAGLGMGVGWGEHEKNRIKFQFLQLCDPGQVYKVLWASLSSLVNSNGDNALKAIVNIT